MAGMDALKDSLSAANRFHEVLRPRVPELTALASKGGAHAAALLLRKIFDSPETQGFHFSFWSRGKCSVTAEEFRQQACVALAEGCLARALSCANCALLWVDHEPIQRYNSLTADHPEMIATLHELRASIMIQMHRPHDCLVELDRTKAKGYPVCSFHHISRKRAECFLKIGDHRSAAEAIQMGISELTGLITTLEQMTPNGGNQLPFGAGEIPKTVPPLPSGATLGSLQELRFEYNKFLSEIGMECNALHEGRCADSESCQGLQTTSGSSSHDPSGQQNSFFGKAPADLADGPSEVSPTIARAIKWDENGVLKAARDIVPGENLICERALTAIPNPEMWWNRCHHCLLRCDLPVPCESCSMALFCSENCHKQATSTHHRYECELMGTLSANAFRGTPLLAVRMVTNLGPAALTKSVLTNNCPAYTDFCDKLRTLAARRTANFPDPHHAVQGALNAIFLAGVVTNNPAFLRDVPRDSTDVFGAPNPEKLKKIQLNISEALLELFKVLPVNCTYVTELVTRSTANWLIQGSYETIVGCAISPVARSCAMSCFPNSYLTFNDDHVIVSSVLPIKQGEEVTLAPASRDFISTEKASRQEILRDVDPGGREQCGCVACRENWPCVAEMCPTIFQVKCSNCHQLLPDITEVNGDKMEIATDDAWPMADVIRTDPMQPPRKRRKTDMGVLPIFGEPEPTMNTGTDVAMDESTVPTVAHREIAECPHCGASTEGQEKLIQDYLQHFDEHHGKVTEGNSEAEEFFKNAMVGLLPIVNMPECRRFIAGYRAMQRFVASRGFHATHHGD